MRSSLVLRASDCQCTSCNLQRSWVRYQHSSAGAADKAVLNIVRKQNKKSPNKYFTKKTLPNLTLTLVWWPVHFSDFFVLGSGSYNWDGLNPDTLKKNLFTWKMSITRGSGSRSETRSRSCDKKYLDPGPPNPVCRMELHYVPGTETTKKINPVANKVQANHITVQEKSVLRIRIHRIHVFWASWIRIRILLSSSKNSKKNFDFYFFVTSFRLFTLEKWCKSTFKK